VYTLSPVHSASDHSRAGCASTASALVHDLPEISIRLGMELEMVEDQNGHAARAPETFQSDQIVEGKPVSRENEIVYITGVRFWLISAA
jgi:hypothetical protein